MQLTDPFSKTRASQIDTHSVYKTYDRWPALARAGLGAEVDLPRGRFRRACFLGMGGSAAGGDIVAGWLTNRPGIDVVVYKGHLPSRNMSDTLAVACSASGTTIETIEMLQTVVKQGATAVSISGGGRLMEVSKRLHVPHIKMPRVVAPRYMLPFIIFACVSIVDAGMSLNSGKETRGSVAEMTGEGAQINLDVPIRENPSKQLASMILARTPSIYGDMTVRGVGNRFKNVLNENSKKHAQFDGIPDAFHNEIEAWEDPRTDFVPVFLRHSRERAIDSEREDKMARILTESGKSPIQVIGRGKATLSQLVTMAYRLDMVSYYVALGLGRDPFPTALIDKLKK
jgi:bifunctional phosphoglucose/phosphomannose isomerase